jgi:hypothetical protein
MRRRSWIARGLGAAALLALAAGPALAQRGGGVMPMREAPTREIPTRDLPVRQSVLDDLDRRQAARRAEAAAQAETGSRDAERRYAAATYDRDLEGRFYRRGEIVVATDKPGAAEAAKALGLTELRRERLPAAGVTLHVFEAPTSKRAAAIVEALRTARPDDAVDFNYIYAFEAAPHAAIRPTALAGPAASGGRLRVVALVDSALPEGAPGLAGVLVQTERFGPGPPRPSAHALAVAQVLADAAGRDNLVILAADVSEPGPYPAASAAAIAQALDWAASAHAPVINVSLTGPPSAAIALVVRRIAARGVTIVAAAGNDGPRAPAPYPAALPEVIGVTAVDDHQRIWRRATQGPHVDFAAYGVKVAIGGADWTGTSLAAPVVSGLLLRPGVTRQSLIRQARDLGEPGRDPVYGEGFVTAPQVTERADGR